MGVGRICMLYLGGGYYVIVGGYWWDIELLLYYFMGVVGVNIILVDGGC